MPPPLTGVAFYVSKKVLSVIIYLRCTRLSQGAIYQLLWIMKSPVIRYTRPPSEDTKWLHPTLHINISPTRKRGDLDDCTFRAAHISQFRQFISFQ